ncbi:MAG: polysaccharide deacetylase family protein, partial [Acidobacteriota bacterium]
MDFLRKIKNSTPNRALVLMYHRIADLDNDPWQLAVSSSNFEQQLKVLKENYRLISVNELINHLDRKSIPKHSVCITFDDGYRDNYLTAKPLLEKYKCPATFFISSHYIDHQQSFWWDELLEIILETETLPQKLSLIINEESFEFSLYDDCVLTDEQRENLKNWVWNEKSPNRRCALYLELWERLRLLQFDDLQTVLGEIKTWADSNGINEQNLPMTSEQLFEIACQP